MNTVHFSDWDVLFVSRAQSQENKSPFYISIMSVWIVSILNDNLASMLAVCLLWTRDVVSLIASTPLLGERCLIMKTLKVRDSR